MFAQNINLCRCLSQMLTDSNHWTGFWLAQIFYQDLSCLSILVNYKQHIQVRTTNLILNNKANVASMSEWNLQSDELW